MWIVSQNRDIAVNMEFAKSIDLQRVKYAESDNQSESDYGYYYVFNNDFDAVVIESPIDDTDDGCYVYGFYKTVERAKQILEAIMTARHDKQSEYCMPLE